MITKEEYKVKYMLEHTGSETVEESEKKLERLVECDCSDENCDGWKIAEPVVSKKIAVKPVYCLKCKALIVPPRYLFKVNMAVGGKIKLTCGIPTCKGGYGYLKG